MDKLQVKEKINKKLVFLTGAGISRESGIATFRDTDGLWENYSIEDVATPMGWLKNRELVLEFYNQRRKDVTKALPNAAHLKLAEFQEHFEEVSIITQNIDDLHERAGSRRILHLHGEIFKSRSVKNPSLVYECRGDIKIGDKCEEGSQLRPHIVWFNEAVPLIPTAEGLVYDADILVIIGTSLAVYPAANLINLVKTGAEIYLIDPVIPEINSRYASRITKIQKPATEGVIELETLLLRKPE